MYVGGGPLKLLTSKDSMCWVDNGGLASVFHYICCYCYCFGRMDTRMHAGYQEYICGGRGQRINCRRCFSPSSQVPDSQTQVVRLDSKYSWTHKVIMFSLPQSLPDPPHSLPTQFQDPSPSYTLALKITMSVAMKFETKKTKSVKTKGVHTTTTATRTT